MQVLTGLLIAEVNVNTMCELGSGGVSLVSNLSFSYIKCNYHGDPLQTAGFELSIIIMMLGRNKNKGLI